MTEFETLRDVPELEFEKALTHREIRTIQVVQIALPLGPAILGGIVILIAALSSVRTADPGSIDLLNLLSASHGFLAVVCYAVAPFVYRMFFSDAQMRRTPRRDVRDRLGHIISWSPAQKCVGLIRSALLIRLMFLEAPAVLGITLFMLATTAGLIKNNPVYWLNLLTPAIMAAYALLRFPTREAIIEVFKSRIRRGDS